MGDRTGIEWTDATWNPIRGCSRVSEGCRNCYAERVAARFSGPGQPYAGLATTWRREPEDEDAGVGLFLPRWTGEVRLVEEHLTDPLRWRRPRRVFVNSMSDLFHEKVPDEWIDRIFAVMALAPQHTFQILTKRPQRMQAYLRDDGENDPWTDTAPRVADRMEPLVEEYGDRGVPRPEDVRSEVCWPLPNVWLGVSVEDQWTADERIPVLLNTPASVRFVSYEPALGPVDFNRLRYRHGSERCECGLPVVQSAFHASVDCAQPRHADRCTEGPEPIDAGTLDWLIVGGESGPGARPFCLATCQDVIAQCRAADVACFVKQLGAWPVDCAEDLTKDEETSRRLILRDRKGGDPAEWPVDLRVREFPAAARGASA